MGEDFEGFGVGGGDLSVRDFVFWCVKEGVFEGVMIYNTNL